MKTVTTAILAALLMAPLAALHAAEDLRFTQSKDGRTLYVIALGVPTADVAIRSLAKPDKTVAAVSLLGSAEKLGWKQADDAVVIQKPASWPCRHAVVFKIELN